ncbi:MAG: hypothetical protein EOM12_03465 [Verrucomicrobiae bacterium]|nr:hypothetical protein [Verrucomicrobiae bacterium]
MDVRIRYRGKTGEWLVSGLMSVKSARDIVASGTYNGAYIVLDEEGWPPYGGAGEETEMDN